MLTCRLACCAVLYAWQEGSHVFRDEFDWFGKSSLFIFQFNFFVLFPFCPCITYSSFFTFYSETSKTSLTLLLPAKTFSIVTPPKSSSSPLIGLDGCFLKGYYGGQLLSAVGQDGNNQIYVIAYAIVDVENKDNWKWFLELLHKDLGNYEHNGWNFISDMQKVWITILVFFSFMLCPFFACILMYSNSWKCYSFRTDVIVSKIMQGLFWYLLI